MATVLKTANPHGFMGSNPIPSAPNLSITIPSVLIASRLHA